MAFRNAGRNFIRRYPQVVMGRVGAERVVHLGALHRRFHSARRVTVELEEELETRTRVTPLWVDFWLSAEEMPLSGAPPGRSRQSIPAWRRGRV